MSDYEHIETEIDAILAMLRHESTVGCSVNIRGAIDIYRKHIAAVTAERDALREKTQQLEKVLSVHGGAMRGIAQAAIDAANEKGGGAVSERYAIVDPMMTTSGGCAGYTTVYKGTMEECLAKRPSGGQRIVTADEETEVAWECDREWITDTAIGAAKEVRGE